MATSYKRAIIQVPLKDLKTFQDYADYYNLSFSSAIMLLAKKSLEAENFIQNFNDFAKTQKPRSKTNKNISKIKK